MLPDLNERLFDSLGRGLVRLRVPYVIRHREEIHYAASCFRPGRETHF